MECLVAVFRRKGTKVSAGKSEVMVLNGKEGLECEIHRTCLGI